MTNQFNTPQRQSPIGVIVMFFDTIRHFIKGLWPIIVVWIFKFDEINKLYFTLGVLLIVIVFSGIAYLKYFNFTFYLDDENQVFVINEGVFNKTKTTIQLHKIQQVNINQSFIQKIIGVFSLDVDTAGSQSKEGQIRAVSHELALSLKSQLLESKKYIVVADGKLNPSDNIDSDERATSPFIKISFSSLIKIGITSNYLRSFLLLFLFYITIEDYFKKITGRHAFDEGEIESYIDKQAIIKFVVIVFLLLFSVVLIINLVRVIFKYFDFKITKQSESLLLSYGLLNTKNTILNPNRVQITTISQNYFQKKMDVLNLKIRQAVSELVGNKNNIIEIPGCNQLEKEQILKLIYNDNPQKGIMLTPNFRKLVFALFLSIGIPLLGYFVFRYNVPELGDTFDYYVPIYVIFVGIIQFFKFKNNRLFVHDDFIIKQSGVWDINLDIINPIKIQGITTSQLFWHKSADIGSLVIHTAGGDLSFQLGNFTKTKYYVNLWLYKIEQSDSNWM